MPQAETAEKAYKEFIDYCKGQLFRSDDHDQEDIAGAFLTSIEEENTIPTSPKTATGSLDDTGDNITS